MNNEFITGVLFEKFNECGKKIIVCQGGGDANKTSDILKWIVIECIKTPKTRATVTGEDLPNLKRGVIRLLVDYILTHEQIAPYIRRKVKENTYIEFYNDSYIDITGFENEQDARGSERDILFINECNSRSYPFFWQLQRKTRRKVFLDFNPTHKFWVHEKLLSGKLPEFKDKVQLYITDHRQNPFLTEEEHQNYEQISDPEMFRVYARGQVGKLKGQIFNFKKIQDKEKIEQIKKLPFGFGIDIGYTSDKTAIVKVYYDNRTRYYEELLYKSETEIIDEIQDNKLGISVFRYMANLLQNNGCTTASLVWGDHDKNYANGLRRLNIPYRMARKGTNSIVQSISKVRECTNYYFNSLNIEEELKTYVWQTATDLLTGNEVTVNEPVDGMPDHCMAAIRYFNYSFGMRYAGSDG